MPKVTINLSTLPVDTKTAETWKEYKEKAKRTNATIFQQMLIHCEKTGFDPLVAPMEWEVEG